MFAWKVLCKKEDFLYNKWSVIVLKAKGSLCGHMFNEGALYNNYRTEHMSDCQIGAVFLLYWKLHSYFSDVFLCVRAVMLSTLLLHAKWMLPPHHRAQHLLPSVLLLSVTPQLGCVDQVWMMERHSLCALMTAAVTLTSGSHGLIRLYSICNVIHLNILLLL